MNSNRIIVWFFLLSEIFFILPQFLKDSFSGTFGDGMSKSIDIINANTDIPQEEKNSLITQFINFAWELQKAKPHWWLIRVLEKGMQYIPEDELLTYLANLAKISISGKKI